MVQSVARIALLGNVSGKALYLVPTTFNHLCDLWQAYASSLLPISALRFWLMKRWTSQVGERLGREMLAPAFTVLGGEAPRLHLDRPLLRGEHQRPKGSHPCEKQSDWGTVCNPVPQSFELVGMPSRREI